MKLLIATRNPGKFKEMEKFLKKLNVTTVSLDDVGIEDDIKETGKTFEENALLKAMHFCQKTNLPTIADDSGLEIDALNGEPGVVSRRWKGHRMTDQEMIDYTLEKMTGVPMKARTCRMVSSISLVLPIPDIQEYTAESVIDGVITEKQILPVQPGYPFRSIFYVPKFKKMLGELSSKEHEEINHRMKALKKLEQYLG